MLVGREAECGRIDSLLAAAAAGRSGALVLRGEAGIGKSALLRYAAERADGMLVLAARGVESEADLAFAGLHELLRPVLGRLASIPEPQAAALAGALALGPPVPGDRFAVSAATLSLLSAAAVERPVLVVVDDVPWLDSSSAEVVRFVLRRLGDDRVAVLAAIRDGEPSALDGAGLPELELSGLALEDARALIPALAPAVAAALVSETEGNPLALEEIPALLTDAQASGAAPLPDPLPASAGIRRAFERRLAALPQDTTHALVVAAASESDRLEVVLRALELLGLDAGCLDAAERAGILALEAGAIAWRHPLLRSAAYHSASSSERRRAHAVLAEALPPEDLSARAWQLAAAAPGRSEQAALELERAGRDALSRQGLDAAARALERAAELSRGAEDRARRLVEAAQIYRMAGRFDRVWPLLDDVLKTTEDPLLRADAVLQRGVSEMWSGDAARAAAVLLSETEQIQALDRDRAVGLLLEACLATQMAGVAPSTYAVAKQAVDVAAQASESLRLRAADQLLGAQMLVGRAPPPDSVRLRLRERAAAPRDSEDAVHVAVHVGHMLTWAEEHQFAHNIFERMLAGAQVSGALGLVPYFAGCLCELEFREGRFAAAREAGGLAVQVAEETEQNNTLSFALVCLARVDSVTGHAEECRARTARALALAHERGVGAIRCYGLSVLGLLELGLGRPSEALASLGPLSELVDEFGLRDPSVVQWRADHIEALTLVGNRHAALDSLAVLEEEAARTERAWARGVAARARGMLAELEFEPFFADALQLLAPFPWEHARTVLRLGERLRRARRPAEARDPLRRALAAFEELGAKPWADRARAELAAAGARQRNADVPTELTAQELRIARLVAEGATNKEAAAQLYLSPKTVGYHLGNVYAKLGIHSRVELARLLAGQERPEG